MGSVTQAPSNLVQPQLAAAVRSFVVGLNCYSTGDNDDSPLTPWHRWRSSAPINAPFFHTVGESGELIGLGMESQMRKELLSSNNPLQSRHQNRPRFKVFYLLDGSLTGGGKMPIFYASHARPTHLLFSPAEKKKGKKKHACLIGFVNPSWYNLTYTIK